MKLLIKIIVFIFTLQVLSGQSLNVFDVDASNFPTIKAKFHALDSEGKQITNLNPNDFDLKEDGQSRIIRSINCPMPKQPKALSSVLVMDASGSMSGNNINLAKEAATLWINELPLGYSECAITAFETQNHLIQDFTTDRNLLLQQTNTFFASGGTSYNAALINPPFGGLLISKTGKNNKVIVFLTDGVSNMPPKLNDIIDEANRQGCAIFSVILGMKCPEGLKEISNKTGGLWFEKITTIDEIQSVYREILINAQNILPCELTWESSTICEVKNINAKIKLLNNNTSSKFAFNLPLNSVEDLEFKPSGIFFMNSIPDIQYDTIVTVTAHNVDLKVTNIITTNPSFSISPTSFSIQNGESIELHISFTPEDSSYSYTDFIFEDDSPCQMKYFSTGGFRGVKPKKKTLLVTHPNGGEEFSIGSDTLITWQGVSPEDKVCIEYSIDKGNTWNIVVKETTGLEYIWKKIPAPESNKCLIKVSQIAENVPTDSLPTILWSKTYGGIRYENFKTVIPAHDGGYVLLGDVNDGMNHSFLWVLKIDESGEIVWQNLFDAKNRTYSNSISKTKDGGYIILGRHGRTNLKDFDIWVLKIDMNGNLVWEKSYGYKYKDIGAEINETNDGGFIIAGGSVGLDESTVADNQYNIGDNLILKIDKNGEIEWQKTYHGNADDILISIKQTADEGYIAVGYTHSTELYGIKNKGGSDFQIIKTDITGNIEWGKLYGGSGSDIAQKVIILPSGNYLVGGYSSSSDGDVLNKNGELTSAWLMELNQSGDIIWQNTYGGDGHDYLFSMVLSNNGEIIFAGESTSSLGDYADNKGVDDMWIAKTDKLGGLIWQRTFGGSSFDVANSVIETNIGGFLLAGYTQSKDYDVIDNKGSYDGWLVKLSPDYSFLQSDTSDVVFSIVAPKPSAREVDMGKVLVGSVRDSVVNEFLIEKGGFQYRVDSIYFTGVDAGAFSLVSGIPPFVVEKSSGYDVEFRFTPYKVGLHNATINIVTQTGKLEYAISGEGIQPVVKKQTDFIDFGKVKLQISKDTLKVPALINIGDVAIPINNIKLVQNSDYNFSILSSYNDVILNSGDTLFLDLRFEPQFVGHQSARVEFSYSGFDSPLVLYLYGQGYMDGDISLTLRMLDAEAHPDNNVKTYLVVEHFNYFDLSGAESISTELHFNPTILLPFDYEAHFIDEKNAKIKIYNLPVDIKVGDTLATIWFRVGLGNWIDSPLKLSYTKSNNNIAKINTIDGKFTLLGICEEGGTRLFNPHGTAGIQQISPNPTDKDIIVQVNLIEKATTKLTIFNSLGIIYNEFIFEGSLGLQEVELSISAYSSGLYFIHLQTPTVNEVKKFVVVK